MKDKLLNIKNEALAMTMQAEGQDELERLRIHYLGKRGMLAQIAHKIRDGETGRVFNEAKAAIEMALNSKFKIRNLKKDIDESLPGKLPPIGHLHPVTHAIEEISSIFEKIGFIRVRYPEVDWDWYAFESLNMPKSHPARDDWETFFVDSPESKKWGKLVLTPHTSNGQVREMERVKNPPIRMVNIGKCYRRQSDVSHTVMFHQFEGLVVDEGINITHLKGTIDYFVKQFFGPNRKSRLRPYHFQFTEPSFEVDVTCDICLGKARLPDGQGCKLCKEGWLELGGAGMVHPNVLKAGKIDTDKYTGFAFGWGVERTYMMKSGVKIDDLRLLYSNDIRFLNQF
jgi:phenylalanyl-tRNA synthetase alpha chain